MNELESMKDYARYLMGLMQIEVVGGRDWLALRNEWRAVREDIKMCQAIETASAATEAESQKQTEIVSVF